jgi:hypothetical protein
LIFAVMAYTGSQSNRARLSETNSRLDNISAIQSVPKGDMDIFQLSLARDKAQLTEERKKQSEKDAKIISSVTQLQVKLKVSPNLEEQLKVDAKAMTAASSVASAPSAAPLVSSAVVVPAPTPSVVPAPAAVEKKPDAQPISKAPATGEKAAGKNPAPRSAKSAVAAKTPAPAAKANEKKPTPAQSSAEKASKANALKKTLDEFNKIDRSK